MAQILENERKGEYEGEIEKANEWKRDLKRRKEEGKLGRYYYCLLCSPCPARLRLKALKALKSQVLPPYSAFRRNSQVSSFSLPAQPQSLSAGGFAWWIS